jgi:hypothetical protein
MDNLHPQSGSPGHETGDVSAGGIVKSAVVLAVLGVFTFFAAEGIMHGLEWFEKTYVDKPIAASEQQAQKERAASEAEQVTKALPVEPGVEPTPAEKRRMAEEMHIQQAFPQPRLQYDDVSDMKAMRNQEREKLNSAGKDKDGIHISIDQAITLLSQRGLPPVTGTFTPVNLAPTSVVVPMAAGNQPAGPGAGAKKP